MTIKQLRAAQKKAAAAKRREQRRKAKERKAAGVARRKVRMAVRMAPKHRLREWSLRVRERDGNKCAVCGSPNYVQSHHLLPKERYQEFKFKRINGLSLCPTHHKMGRFSAHRSPIWFTIWLKENRPLQYQWCLDNMGEREPYEATRTNAGISS